METQSSPASPPGSINGNMEGLYQQKRSSIGMLMNPQVLCRLQGIYNNAAAATQDGQDGQRPCSSPEIDIREEMIELLKRNIATYNARNNGFGKFTVFHTEVGIEDGRIPCVLLCRFLHWYWNSKYGIQELNLVFKRNSPAIEKRKY